MKSAKGRILVLGAAGMVGHKAWQVLRSRFDDVWGTIHKPRSTYEWHPLFMDAPPGRLLDGVDLSAPDRILPVLDKVQPDIVVNCVGLTFSRKDSKSVEANIRLNALLPHVIGSWCGENSKRLISFSTDCVFSGKTGGYTEESVTDARDAYGRSKALGEVEAPYALILRTSVVGRELEYRTQLLEWFLAQRGKTIQGYRSTYFSGVSTLFLGTLVSDLIEKFPKLSGVYQVASEPISKYHLLQEFQKHFNVDVTVVPDDTKVVRKDLNGSKFLAATGLKVPPWPQMVADLRADPTPYDRPTEQSPKSIAAT